MTRKKLERPTTPAERAQDARACLSAARIRLSKLGYVQTRFDQYEHPVSKTMVETGYTYGETRLVVHIWHPDWVSPEKVDFRLCGTSDMFEQDPKFLSFERLIAV